MTYITKEEFGLDLYETIFTIGKILGVQSKAKKAVKKQEHYLVRAAQQEEQQLRAELAKLMDKLSDKDAADVVRRYPWVLE